MDAKSVRKFKRPFCVGEVIGESAGDDDKLDIAVLVPDGSDIWGPYKALIDGKSGSPIVESIPIGAVRARFSRLVRERMPKRVIDLLKKEFDPR